MAYGFIESDLIRYVLIERDETPETLSTVIDMMCDYIVDDMLDESVPYYVFEKRDVALERAIRAYDSKDYGLCLGYIDDYFAV